MKILLNSITIARYRLSLVVRTERILAMDVTGAVFGAKGIGDRPIGYYCANGID